MSEPTDLPAFPSTHGDLACMGMTLRDYFAAKAMQSLLSNPGGPIQAKSFQAWGFCNCRPADVSTFAYQMAEAMLEERNRGK